MGQHKAERTKQVTLPIKCDGPKKIKSNLQFSYRLAIKEYLRWPFPLMAEVCKTRWFKFEGLHAQFLWICSAFKVLKSPAGTTDDFFECFLVISKQTILTVSTKSCPSSPNTIQAILQTLPVCCKCQPLPSFSESWLRKIIQRRKNYFKFQKNNLCPVCGLGKVSGQLFILPPPVPTLQFTMETWTKECSWNGYSQSGHTTLKTRLRDLFVQEDQPSTFTMC